MGPVSVRTPRLERGKRVSKFFVSDQGGNTVHDTIGEFYLTTIFFFFFDRV